MIMAWHRSNETSKRLNCIPGDGLIGRFWGRQHSRRSITRLTKSLSYIFADFFLFSLLPIWT